MRNFFLILKIRVQEKFDLSSRLMLFILYAAMFAGVYFAADYLKTLGLAQVLPVVGYFGAVVLTFITTVIKINETFSGSEDSEFLLSMPFSSAVQVFVMFIMMFLSNLLICILMELPTYLVYRSTEFGAGFGIGRWILGLLLTSLPFGGIAVAVGMFIILSLVSSPKKNQIVSFICLFFLCIACILGILVVDRIYLVASGQVVYEAGNAATGFLKEITRNFKFGRFYQLGIVEGEGAYIFLFSFLSIIWYVVFLFIHTIAYQGTITALRSPLSYSESSREDIAKQLKEKRLFAVLVQKEWNQFIRSKYYLLQCAIGLILGIIVPVNFLIMGNMGLEKTTFIVPALICFFIGCSNTTYCSMSMEGKRHWIMESSPVFMQELKKAKILLHIILVFPIIIFAGISMGAAFRMSISGVVSSMMISILYAVLLAIWGNYLGERFADYSRESESMVLHRGIPFVFGYLPGILLPIVILVLSI